MTNSAIDESLIVEILTLRRDLYIETQALKQALVNKGTLSKEDIHEAIDYVKLNSPTVKQYNEELSEFTNRLDDHTEFLEMYSKMKNNELSDEERKAFAAKIDANPGKYGKWLMEVMKNQ